MPGTVSELGAVAPGQVVGHLPQLVRISYVLTPDHFYATLTAWPNAGVEELQARLQVRSVGSVLKGAQWGGGVNSYIRHCVQAYRVAEKSPGAEVMEKGYLKRN